jgi:hypothetical protein
MHFSKKITEFISNLSLFSCFTCVPDAISKCGCVENYYQNWENLLIHCPDCRFIGITRHVVDPLLPLLHASPKHEAIDTTADVQKARVHFINDFSSQEWVHRFVFTSVLYRKSRRSISSMSSCKFCFYLCL